MRRTQRDSVLSSETEQELGSRPPRCPHGQRTARQESHSSVSLLAVDGLGLEKYNREVSGGPENQRQADGGLH